MNIALREQLDRVLDENKALLGSYNSPNDRLGSPTVHSGRDRTVADWYNSSALTVPNDPYGLNSDDNPSIQASCSFTTETPQYSAAVRLNDCFRSHGLPPVGTEASLEDIIRNCIDAIDEMANRTSAKRPEPPRRSLAMSYSKQEHPKIPRAFPDIPVVAHEERSKLSSDLKRLEKVSSVQSQRIHSLETQLRLRDSELSKLKEFIQEKTREEDRRSALTVASLRDQKLSNSGFVAINNLHKQIDMLTKENEVLKRKCQNLNVRLRHGGIEKPESTEISELHQELNEANDTCHFLSRKLEESITTVHALKAELARKEAAMYEAKEETLFVKKQISKPRQEQELLDLTGALNMSELREQSTRLSQLIMPRVTEMMSVVFPQGTDSEISEQSLTCLVNRIRDLVNLEITVRKYFVTSESAPDVDGQLRNMFDRIASFELGRDPDITQLVSILGLRDRSDLVRRITDLQFKKEELVNFYNDLVSLLRLRKGCSLAECMRQITKLTTKDPFPV
jgi:hypothetical protein